MGIPVTFFFLFRFTPISESKKSDKYSGLIAKLNIVIGIQNLPHLKKPPNIKCGKML
jgi:hypothetical protein